MLIFCGFLFCHCFQHLSQQNKAQRISVQMRKTQHKEMEEKRRKIPDKGKIQFNDDWAFDIL